MKVLIIGGGGREHALAWKLAQSPKVTEVLCAPGNAGTATEQKTHNVALGVTDFPALIDLARKERVALTIVGQEGKRLLHGRSKVLDCLAAIQPVGKGKAAG